MAKLIQASFGLLIFINTITDNKPLAFATIATILLIDWLTPARYSYKFAYLLISGSAFGLYAAMLFSILCANLDIRVLAVVLFTIGSTMLSKRLYAKI